MLIWLSLVIFVLALGFAIWKWKADLPDAVAAAAWVILVVSGLTLFISSFATFILIGDAIDMKAFYEANITVYKSSITDTTAILSVESGDKHLVLVDGSIERVSVGIMAADRIKDLRDNTVLYNRKFAYYEMIKQNIWLSNIFPEMPAGLKYITIE
jgi:hypothetical protein